MTKRIVLLSDGTGQRGGVGFATNVWLLNEALPRDDQQLVCYDDGVGSQKLLFNRVVGGALGVGLARNVRHLYSFLVRTWESDADIYLFGFSRGAFTVRLLAGLIDKCGIIDLAKNINSEKELDAAVRAAYCAFRTSHFFPGVARRFKDEFGVINNATGSTRIPIRFVGVWETVDAVGVPLDEMRDAFDQILRYSFRDNLLSPAVKVGRHAVAIDEARRTFMPVMWDQRLESGDRIRQVWFSGVHSNVGGGYAKRQMAMIPLTWMMREAIAEGLRIDTAKMEEYQRAADIYGRLYDSRAGLAAYYRYGPRDMSEIATEYTRQAVQVHHSVFSRIEQAFDSYSPHNLPDKSEIVGGQGGQFILPTDSRRVMDLAKGVSWWRRLLLGVLWIATLTFLLSPWLTPESRVPGPVADIADRVATVAQWNLPSAAEEWTNALREHPWLTLAGVSTLLGLLWIRSHIMASVNELANAAWYPVFPGHRTPSADASRQFGAKDPIRLAQWAQGSTWPSASGRLLGSLFIGLLSLLLVIPLKVGQVAHRRWCLRGARLKAIRDGVSAAPLAPEEDQTLVFLPKDYKCLTGIRVIAGQKYRIRVDRHAGWFDGSYSASPNGLEKSVGADRFDRMAWPFKRHPSARLMTLMARVQHPFLRWCRVASTTAAIGEDGTIVPAKDGELTLYVNDAMLVNVPVLRGMLFGLRELFYRNNRGIALIRVSCEPPDTDRAPSGH